MAERKTYTDLQKAEILKKAEETSVSAASKEFGVAAKPSQTGRRSPK